VGERGRSGDRAIQHEALCRQYLMALSAWTPRLLTERAMLASREWFKP
jgi:hypothetical protein